MHGQDILVRSLTVPHTADKYGNIWQYHSRSDRHSKIGCWAILFDLLNHCPLLREHAAAGKTAFGINHAMTQFTTGRRKKLDLVLCIPHGDVQSRDQPVAFDALVAGYGVELSAAELDMLVRLPVVHNRPVGDVLLALESKACMTAHVKAGPRFYDELTASAECIHGTAQQAIAVGFAIVNASATFVSADRNKFSLLTNAVEMSVHDQPNDAEFAQSVLARLPVRSHVSGHGFDAIGITTVLMRNDGSPVHLAPVPPSLPPQHQFHYETMIRRIAGIYTSRFAAI